MLFRKTIRKIVVLATAFCCIVLMHLYFNSKQVEKSRRSLTKVVALNATMSPLLTAPHQEHVIINLTNWDRFLTSPECGEYNMIIMVTSSPMNTEKRDSIRKTWGRGWYNQVDLPKYRTFFQLGVSQDQRIHKLAVEEFATNRDIVIGDFTDTFYALPVKVLMGFKWASSHCKFKYLFKIDDDVFVHIPRTFEYLNRWYVPSKGLYTGHVQFKTGPSRDGKYKITMREYPLKFYPAFVSGGGILLSTDVVEAMVRKFNVSNYFKLDDVFVGMLALQVGVFPIHDRYFNVWHDEKSCNCFSTDIIHHKVGSTKCMRILYDCK